MPYICLECNNIFEEPKSWEEKHMLDTPPYEKLSGSPCCYGAYTEAFRCDCCGEWITTEEYIRTNDGERFCEECFQHVRLGDED